jgi:hypothetical protein
MAIVSFAGFRTFLEKYEAKTQKDKDAKKDRASASSKPMDSLGGEMYHFVRGPKKNRGAMYAHIKRTNPEILTAADIAGVKANYLPVNITPGIRGGSVEPIDVGYQAQATDDNMRDLGPEEIMRKLRGRHMKRKDLTTGVYDRWASAAAAAGGAPGGAAPPM